MFVLRAGGGTEQNKLLKEHGFMRIAPAWAVSVRVRGCMGWDAAPDYQVPR
jgi:hypothetical protein